MNEDLITYYRDRAKEYDVIYQKPERQHDLIQAAYYLQDLFREKNLLEIACGTGYWTEKMSKTASRIHATDINKTVIDVAMKQPWRDIVSFQVIDFYELVHIDKFDHLFGGFIWSHLPLEQLDTFLTKAASLVNNNGTLCFMDNHYVAGSNTIISETDKLGNTYQTRILKDGSNHLVLKNFPTNQQLKKQLSKISTEISIINLEYYWIATCRINKQ